MKIAMLAPDRRPLAGRRPKALTALASAAVLLLAATSLHAITQAPKNLGPGLDALVSSRVALQNAQAQAAQTNSKQKPQTFRAIGGKLYGSKQAVDVANSALGDGQGRVMVMIRLNGLASLGDVRNKIQASAASLTITAVDSRYRAGVLEGYIDVDDVAKVATTLGVSNVMLEFKPELNRIPKTGPASPNVVPGQTLTMLGTAFDQGVTQHRIDTINKYYNPSATSDYEGQGMQIGFISDSFGKTTTVTPATDVSNFDLPGASGNPVNTTPVTVLQDAPSGGTDEGRGMVQIGYKMAPKAALAFATANTGEVGFANNIRALAGLPGYTYPGQTFAADVICDDVGYSDEPFFEDGLIAQGVNDVAAAGVSYFSSAGNDIGTYDYDSDFRYVPYTGGTTAADSTALAGTNINLAGVPSNLYQGGFHNFNPSPGARDVALTYNLKLTTTQLPATNFQWNDPFNQTLSYNTPAIYSAAGNIPSSSGNTDTFTTPTLNAGQNYVIIESADTGSSFDGIVTIKDPNGVVVVNQQDTGTDETINLYPTVTGPYTIVVQAYSTTGGPYHVNVYTGNNPQISTDFNVLTFDLSGNYLPASSLTTNNLSTNVPQEYGKTPPKNATTASFGEGAVQYVIARSSVPTAPNPADHFRILVRGNGLSGIGPAEYFTINTPNTKGHAMAQGCNGTAAYSVFRPNLPEYFTSPGPATVYFDSNGNRLATPEVRLQPRIAAADAGNTSFFSSDVVADLDTKPNFSGTSAAAPHAAAIAALVVQAHGGRGSVTPAQMTNLLQRSTFVHDLDPNSATGVTRIAGASSGKMTITVNSDLGLNPSAGAFNPNSIALNYSGSSSVATLTFNPEGTAATGGNTTGGNNGVDTSNPPMYFSNIYPGIVFEPNTIAFTIGTKTPGSFSGTTASFTNQAPAPSVAGQVWTMTLNFTGGAFTGGNTFYFTTGHGPQHNSQVSNSTGPAGGVTSTSFTQADLFGGTTLLPDGTAPANGAGMTFNGTLMDGSTFSGTLKNRLGAGWAPTDGYGFINAEQAVVAPVQ